MNRPSAAAQVLVLGSLNMDLLVHIQRAPEAGETLTAHSFIANPGGKGANQAVACARQGARVSMVGCVGSDPFGSSLLSALVADGVDVHGVRAVSGSSGVALIMVDDMGQNRIAVVPGANASVCIEDADALIDQLKSAEMLVMQLEIPVPAVLHAAKLAKQCGCKVLLNPAPVQRLPVELWPLVDILVVNESEAADLSGFSQVNKSNAGEVATALLGLGTSQVIVTLGADGLVWTEDDLVHYMAAHTVIALDTTAAGDTFVGALCAALIEGKKMQAALAHATQAAAICVTRFGAQVSIPWRAEVQFLL